MICFIKKIKYGIQKFKFVSWIEKQSIARTKFIDAGNYKFSGVFKIMSFNSY